MPEHSTRSTRNGDVQRATTWLTPDQIEAMRSACLTAAFPDYLQERNVTVLDVLYDAGLRASELVGLDVAHLQLDETPATIYLPSTLQKGDPGAATVELAPETRDQLRRYLRDRWKDTEALFPTRSSPRLSTRSLQRLITKIARVAEVRPQTVAWRTSS